MKCPYCNTDGIYVNDKSDLSGECTNEKCGGFFVMEPKWEMNKDWVDEDEKV